MSKSSEEFSLFGRSVVSQACKPTVAEPTEVEIWLLFGAYAEHVGGTDGPVWEGQGWACLCLGLLGIRYVGSC